MPRTSFKDLSTGGGFQVEGKFEVSDSYFAVVQLPPNSTTNVQSAPFPALVFEGYKLDEGWDRANDAELQTCQFRVAGNLEVCRPGALKNPDDLDEEPEDLGREVGTKGNGLYLDGGKKPYSDSAFGMLIESLLKPGGFKPSEIDKACASSFIGMKLEFKHAAMKTYKDKNTGKDVTPTTSVCAAAIHTYPYEQAKAGKKAAPKTGAKTPAPAKSAAPAPAPAADVSTGPMEFVQALIVNHADQVAKAFPAGTAVKVSTFRMKCQQLMMLDKTDKDTTKAVVELLKDDEQLMELGVSANFLFDAEAGTVTFQE